MAIGINHSKRTQEELLRVRKGQCSALVFIKYLYLEVLNSMFSSPTEFGKEQTSNDGNSTWYHRIFDPRTRLARQWSIDQFDLTRSWRVHAAVRVIRIQYLDVRVQ